MEYQADVTIVGAGVIGLSIAAQVASQDRDVCVLERNETFDSSQRRAFYEAVVRFLPFIEYDDLEPDMAGIRPKLEEPQGSFRDFVIRYEYDRGLPGLINLIGIESPGLTACPAIAKYVADMVDEMGL